ncbi:MULTISPECIES: DUF2809 domain-containing protein [Actinoplanes]|uniref:ribosomal maturation YjgA family protein n=1 Tax=Actinoplanes TaxID=1865 RepID=UPI0005F2804C|nr:MULTISPECIES: DUF2809 domain-containing protein [Actinoplanes]GLY04374.1 membrane protein [Actinoplanes sp. NBRC 101535]
MIMETRWVRLSAVATVALCLVAAFGIRSFTGTGSGVLAQSSGTLLYASVIYAGLAFLWPRARPLILAAGAIGFCWAVELSQLTGIPAYLSARSLAARLILGSQFDLVDMAWYPVGVLPLAVLHYWLIRAKR